MLKYRRFKQFVAVKFLGIILVFSSVILFLSATQKDSILSTINRFNAFQQIVPFEKVYVHTDKAYYTLGERIWFKTYLVDGKNCADTLSGVVYVELINQDKQVIAEVMLKVDSATCKGDIFLPDTLSPGTYQLRAYTNYQRNFGSNFFFKKNIPVFSPGNKKYEWQITRVKKEIGIATDFAYKIVLLNRKSKPQKNISVSYKISASGLKTSKGEAVTSSDGSFYIALNYPVKKQISECTVEFSVDGEKQKWKYTLPLNELLLRTGFFPEGGNFVEGVDNRVAFKITDERGVGAKAKLMIFDKDSTLLTTIVSNRFGMGTFNINPVNGGNYYAYISQNGVLYGKYYLPKPQKDSYVLFVENQRKSDVYLRAVCNSDIGNQGLWSIICQSKGEVVYTLQGKPIDGTLNAKIPKSELPAGVCQITLFNQLMIPQCERLIFIKQQSKPDMSLTTSKLQDGTHNFIIQLNDSLMKSANISLSIINRNIIDDILPFQDNIYSYLELTSELRGYIENPGYYFKDDSLMRAIYLDYLLMTQGWRKFVWEEMLTDELPIFTYSVERAIKVSGIISNFSNKIKTDDEVTMMIYKNKEKPDIMETSTDSTGRFVFYTHFSDTVKTLIQTKKKRKRNNHSIDRRLVLETKSTPLVEDYIPYSPGTDALFSVGKIQHSGEIREIVNKKYEFGDSHIIAEVTVKGVNSNNAGLGVLMKSMNLEEMEEEIRNRNNYDYPNIYYFIADNYVQATLSSPSVMAVMKKDLSKGLDGLPKSEGGSGGSGGAGRWGDKSALYEDMVNDDIVLINNQVPLYVINGDPMNGINSKTVVPIDMIDWHSLKSIKIYDTGANKYSLMGDPFRPVIVLELNDDGRIRTPHTGMRKIKLVGYYRAKEFYHPIVSEDVRRNIPEYRSTVYWNPELKCDSTGVFSFHLKRKSLPSNIDICIEGVTDYGSPVFKTFNINR